MKELGKNIQLSESYKKEFAEYFINASETIKKQLTYSLLNFYTREVSAFELKLSCTSLNAEQLVSQLFELNLKHFSQLTQKTVVAIWIQEYCPFYNQQQVYLAREIQKRPEFVLVILQTHEPVTLEVTDLNEVFCQSNSFYIPDSSLLKKLEFVQVIFALDFAAAKFVELPPKAIRINQPHGMDIKFNYSIEFYGAMLMFDVLMSPSLSNKLFPADYLTKYLNIFGPDQIDHNSDRLTCFPIGSPKLDYFINKARAERLLEARDIIYNLSFWGLESNFVKENLYDNIDAILNNFPNERLVFRCFPGQEKEILPL